MSPPTSSDLTSKKSAEAMRKRKTALTYLQRLKAMQDAAISESPPVGRPIDDLDSLPTLDERIDSILGLLDNNKRPASNMLFFIMYDIESNKVRYNVVKYLQRKGCTRIQKSIFLADLPSKTYSEIKSDLAEIQSLYDNHDSIIICPISTDLLQNMKIIGQNINMDIILKNKNTLFF